MKNMSLIEIKFPDIHKPGKIKKWNVNIGSIVTVGKILLVYEDINEAENKSKEKEKKLKANQFGRVIKLLKNVNDVVQPEEIMLLIESCNHPTVIKDLCAECGADLRENSISNIKDITTHASVPMVHSVPDLKVCPELAIKIGKEDQLRLLRDKKLALLVDLDQTVVHTTNDTISAHLKDVFHFQLYGPLSPWYHTRVRPHTFHFLLEMSKLFELHICTFGARNYAHKVASLLDPDGKLFCQRILSRDECFDPLSKTANLRALFPCGVDLVCIIDDREDVWQGCGNLVQVKPYLFFQHTGDINAPPDIVNDHSFLEKNFLSDNFNFKSDNSVQLKLNEATDDFNTNNYKISEEKIKRFRKSYNTCVQSITINDESCSKKIILDNALNSETAEKKVENSFKPSSENLLVRESETKNAKTQESEDTDDYLLYLEDILKRIHSEFYYGLSKLSVETRSLREIIPLVKSRVLKNVYITFSGLIPNHLKLTESRAYKVAKSFGAQVTQDLNSQSTHLVALQQGTAKVNKAKKEGKVKIVNPDWLWTCAERWEHVDERLYPLTSKIRGSRIPPPHCSSPGHPVDDDVSEKIEIDSFADTINPLMIFTQEEIDIMDKEVDDDMSDQETESIIEEEHKLKKSETYLHSRKREFTDDADINDVVCSSYQLPEIKNKKMNIFQENINNDTGSKNQYNYSQRRVDLNSYDAVNLSQDSFDGSLIKDTDEEKKWDAMGAALEKEFLS